MSRHRPESTAQAQAAYTAWVQRQGEGREDLPAWEALPAREQDAWCRAVRLLAVLGRAGEGEA